MLTPQTLDALPDELISLIDELQTDIIKSIAKKITKADYLTPSAEWQLYKAAQLRMSTKEITELLAKYTGKSKREIRRLYNEACRQAINEDAKIYRAYGKDASSFTRSVAFSNALKAGIANADGMMQNFTKSMVQSSRKTVTHLMDKAYLKVLSGAFSPQEAVYSAVAELAAKGIQSVTYPSGRTDWADVAIRRAVITGIGQTAGRMQLELAEEMDCDLVEVTSHMGARPSHAEWQGKVYSISGKSMKYPPLSVTGYGTGAGLKGWNCRHDFYPFFEGISERASFPIDKAENAKEYELSQKQRSMERAIRRSKRGLAALNESINSTDDPELKAKLQSRFDRSSATLKQQEQRMNEFCEANDLIVRNDRVRVVGFGKSVSQRAVHGSKRYVKKQGGGSGTSGGTAAKKNKAEKVKAVETDSKDKIQTLDYTTRKNGKPELLMSAGVDKSGKSGIIEDKEVTVEKLKVEEFTDEQNDKLYNAHKNLIEQLKDKVFGTEVSADYDLDMEQIIIDDIGYFVGTQGKSPVIDPGIAFISIHNHPTNSNLSILDLVAFAETDNMLGISVIGNSGINPQIMFKTDNFDNMNFLKCIYNRCNNIPIFEGKTYNEIVDENLVDSLSEPEKEKLWQSLNNFLKDTAKECEKYGVTFTS